MCVCVCVCFVFIYLFIFLLFTPLRIFIKTSLTSHYPPVSHVLSNKEATCVKSDRQIPYVMCFILLANLGSVSLLQSMVKIRSIEDGFGKQGGHIFGDEVSCW